ncbi:hypothetical protein ACOSHH_004963 [Klebsiella aerogenes]
MIRSRTLILFCCLTQTYSIYAASNSSQFLSDIKELKLPENSNTKSLEKKTSLPKNANANLKSIPNTRTPPKNKEQPIIKKLKRHKLSTQRDKDDFLTKQNAMLEKKSKDLSAELLKLRNENILLYQVNEQLNQHKETKVGTLMKKITELGIKNSEYQTEGNKLRVQLKSQQEQQSVAQKEYNVKAMRLQEKFLTQAKEKSDINAKNSELQIVNEKLRDRLKSQQELQIEAQKACNVTAMRLQEKILTQAKEKPVLDAKNSELQVVNDKLRKQLKSQQELRSEAQKAYNVTAMRLQQKIDTLVKENAELDANSNEFKTTADKLRIQLTKLQSELKNSISKNKTEIKTQQSKDNAQNVKKFINELPIMLQTDLQLRSYAVGATFAEVIRNQVKKSHSMGLDLDVETILTGINDGYNGQLRLNEGRVNAIKDEMNKDLIVKRDKQTELGKKGLDDAIKGKKIIQKKGGIAFALIKNGTDEYKNGEVVVLDSLESTLAGNPIVNNYNIKMVYSDKLPPMIKDAIKFGKRKGKVDLYGFAGNIYSSNNVPDGLSVDTPVKISLIFN